MKLSTNIIDSIKAIKCNNFGLAPEGDYTLRIDSIDAGKPKTGEGYRTLTWLTIVGPSFQNNSLFDVCSLENPKNKQAEGIGRMRFKNMILATGFSDENIDDNFDTDQLCGKMVNAHVVIEDGHDEYGPRNRVQYFR